MSSTRRAARVIGAGTRLFCVLGHPVRHSLSPAMHNAALEAMGEDAVYAAFDVAPENLRVALAGIRALGVAGANLTIPHKEHAMGLVDRVSTEATLIGAVNTVGFRDGALVGENTDGRGFLDALFAAGFEPRGCQATLLGAGGSARAVAFSLVQAGARVTIANRTLARAQALAVMLIRHFGEGCAAALALADPALAGRVAESDILVNTTPAGMAPDSDARPPVAEAMLHAGLFVFDLVYNPVETPLLAAARRRACRTANGLAMLARQGALALEFWLGRPAPAELMEEAALAALLRLQGREGCQ